MFFNRFNLKKLKLKYKYSFWIIAVLLIAIAIFQLVPNSYKSEGEFKENAQQVNKPLETQVHLITHYVCGQDLIETTTEKNKSLEEITNQYSDWHLVEAKNNTITFEKYIEDLGPECREGAYFGLSSDGILTLYHGEPKENEVIETFFRIDIESLESGLPKNPVEQLYKGIPVKDLTEYNSILSTYSEFELVENQ